MKTIQLTDDQFLGFQRLADLMTTQSNRITQYPLFYVYEKQEIWVDGDDSATGIKFVGPEGVTDTQYDENNHEWTRCDGEFEECWKCKETGETIDDAEVKFDLRIVHIREEDIPVVNVGPFFTEEAANEHIRLNHYHYRKPFTYVNSAWRNYEMQEMLQMIFVIAGKPIPSCYQ